MTNRSGARGTGAFELPWMDAFIVALNGSGNVVRAAGVAGISTSTAYRNRQRYEVFADAWDAATPARARFRESATTPTGPAGRQAHWRYKFLAALAETSNVTAAAMAAGVDPAKVYRKRRTHAGFAAQWQLAILEGYEHLELEVLGYLRNDNPSRKMDVAAALRLLAAHRDTVVRLKALSGDEDEEAVRESLVAFLEDMRQRRLANQAILIEAQGAEAQDDRQVDGADVAG